MKDKNRIINCMMEAAADVMEAKVEYNNLVAEQMYEKGKYLEANSLYQQNQEIKEAINVIRRFGGCWA